eukprot:scaffold72813_cov26-Attheya_sp.AAC.1
MPSGGHNRKRKHGPRRNAQGYISIQCEHCAPCFPSSASLAKHRTLSAPFYNHYHCLPQHDHIIGNNPSHPSNLEKK